MRHGRVFMFHLAGHLHFTTLGCLWFCCCFSCILNVSCVHYTQFTMCQLLQAFCHICLSDSGVVFESKVLVSRHFRDIKSLGLEAKVLVILSKRKSWSWSSEKKSCEFQDFLLLISVQKYYVMTYYVVLLNRPSCLTVVN